MGINSSLRLPIEFILTFMYKPMPERHSMMYLQ